MRYNQLFKNKPDAQLVNELTDQYGNYWLTGKEILIVQTRHILNYRNMLNNVGTRLWEHLKESIFSRIDLEEKGLLYTDNPIEEPHNPYTIRKSRKYTSYNLIYVGDTVAKSIEREYEEDSKFRKKIDSIIEAWL